MLRVALPDLPTAELFAAGLQTGPEQRRPAVVRVPAHQTAEVLAAGEADVALVPTLAVLRAPKAFSVVPGVALSAWDYPFARLLLRDGLGGGVATVAFDPREAQAVLLARLVLREHYGFAPAFVPVEAPTAAALGANDAVLVTGEAAVRSAVGADAEREGLDLGQEWYELANYPFVWGLFVTRAGEATPEVVRLLLSAVAAAEAQRGYWIRSREMPEPLHAFFAESLRLRLDDLATASLTELGEHFFSLGVLDELPEIPYADLPDAADEGPDEGPTPLV